MHGSRISNINLAVINSFETFLGFTSGIKLNKYKFVLVFLICVKTGLANMSSKDGQPRSV